MKILFTILFIGAIFISCTKNSEIYDPSIKSEESDFFWGRKKPFVSGETEYFPWGHYILDSFNLPVLYYVDDKNTK